jgi:hypothetical protein
MAAAMSDSPSAADDVARKALWGMGIGTALVVFQVILWIVEKYHG